MNSNLLIATLGTLFVVFASVYGLRFVYEYRVKNRAVEIVLFHLLLVYRVPVRDIDLIKKISWREASAGGGILRLGNRLTTQCVLIHKRRGWVRRIVITPEDPDGFVGRVVKDKQGAVRSPHMA